MGPTSRRLTVGRASLLLPLLALALGACEAAGPVVTPPVVAGSSAQPREVNLVAKDYSFLPDIVDLVPGEYAAIFALVSGMSSAITVSSNGMPACVIASHGLSDQDE